MWARRSVDPPVVAPPRKPDASERCRTLVAGQTRLSSDTIAPAITLGYP